VNETDGNGPLVPEVAPQAQYSYGPDNGVGGKKIRRPAGLNRSVVYYQDVKNAWIGV
jgi:hypothetical protein